MKVAAIVITYNDDYKFREWVGHHKLYKDELYKHIIVDNGSSPAYLKLVEESFPGSHLIKRTINGGCTGAYNDGIKLALSDPAVDAIMLIGNDIRLEVGGTAKLYDFLFSNPLFGMVSPVLLAKDSEIIDDFGCDISKKLYMLPYDFGKKLSEVETKHRMVKSVTGGMNMARREFYEQVGLQDENLFMYSDEVDMALRTQKTGYIMAATQLARAWHQHINPKAGSHRADFTYYLIGRNKMYLARKHFGIMRISYVFGALLWRTAFAMAFGLFNRTSLKQQLYFFWGILNGLVKNMELPGFILKS